MSKPSAFRKSPAAKTSVTTDSFLSGSAMVGRTPAAPLPPQQPASNQPVSVTVGMLDAALGPVKTSVSSLADDRSTYRIVNVKLNKRRYSLLKALSAETEKPMQQYFVELLDVLLEQNRAILERRGLL